MRAQSLDVETLGEQVARRRRAVGYDVAPFAKEAGVSRETLSKIESGAGFRDKTISKIMRTLDRLEAEVGLDVPAAVEEPVGQVVTFRAQGVFGAAEVTVAGPIENTAELAEQFAKLLDNLRRRENGDD